MLNGEILRWQSNIKIANTDSLGVQKHINTEYKHLTPADTHINIKYKQLTPVMFSASFEREGGVSGGAGRAMLLRARRGEAGLGRILHKTQNYAKVKQVFSEITCWNYVLNLLCRFSPEAVLRRRVFMQIVEERKVGIFLH